MNKINKIQSGFGTLEIILVIFALVVIAGAGWYVWHSKKSVDKKNTPTVNTQTSPAISATTFTGTVLGDECAQASQAGGSGKTPYPPIGDAGCSIMVEDSGEIIRDINIVHGNALVKSWGKVEGFTISQDISGEMVSVKAHQDKGSYYSLSSADDYVKLVKQSPGTFVKVN